MKLLASFCVQLAFIFSAVAQEAPEFLKAFPSKAFYQRKSGDQVVGKTAFQWEMDGDLIRFQEISTMQLNLYNQQQTISTDITVRTNANIEIQDFHFQMKTQGATIEVTGSRSGSIMKMKVQQVGRTQLKDLIIQEPMLLSPTIHPFLLKMGLKPGKHKIDANLLEPSALSLVPVTLATERLLTNPPRWLLEISYLSQSSKSEILGSGALLFEKSDLAGLTIVATPITEAEFALLQLQGTKTDLVKLARVGFPNLLKPAELKSLKVKISGVDVKGFQLNRHRQKFDKGVLSVQSEVPPASGEPIQSMVGKKGFETYLEGDPSIPVFDPIIQKKAREIVGNEPDLWKRALLINQYVYKTLEKVPTISIPNALEVLATKRGDCNEHAALYTALARAAGVPTRTVVGLVYADRFYGEAGFYYHAWVEIFTGKEWVALDPTWNQVPADATHLAFVEGSLDKQIQVTALMGKIKLSPIAESPRSTTN